MYKTMNSLPENTRSEMVSMLNDALASAIDFQLQSKQAHWNVKGPSFIALHELFDDVFEAATEAVDLIAERVAQLGGTAAGTIQQVSAATKLAPYPTSIASGSDHVEALAGALSTFCKLCAGYIEKSDQAGDQGTADMCTEILRAADKNLWFLEAHLQG